MHSHLWSGLEGKLGLVAELCTAAFHWLSRRRLPVVVDALDKTVEPVDHLLAYTHTQEQKRDPTTNPPPTHTHTHTHTHTQRHRTTADQSMNASRRVAVDIVGTHCACLRHNPAGRQAGRQGGHGAASVLQSRPSSPRPAASSALAFHFATGRAGHACLGCNGWQLEKIAARNQLESTKRPARMRLRRWCRGTASRIGQEQESQAWVGGGCVCTVLSRTGLTWVA